MIGKSILHYNIIEKLGEGGMGVVYKAEDTKLDRIVAIKFLPRHVAGNEEEKQRFVIEAKAAASLNHPNIATIHAIEESVNEMFIVMEYIEGRELKDIVGMPLHIDDVINYATQIAEGLQAAHKKGIVHRDIKSSNIMITEDNKIKIMDFGLAKVHGGTLVTKSGTTLGTAAYMSPEQARGNEVDHRSDIWSFGVVLYEMLTGRLPFKGDYEQAVIYSIMNEDPEPPATLGTDAPMGLEGIILKALTKDINKRYQGADEIIRVLKSIRIATITSEKPTPRKKKAMLYSVFTAALLIAIALGIFFWKGTAPKVNSNALVQRIAVLPFANVRDDPEIDFLGFALADQIINGLIYVKDILVRPSSAVRQYQLQPIDAPTAGRELNVDYVLAGNYLKEGDLVRLNIELVNTHSNTLLWRESIEATYENAFRLQDMVAEKVIAGLKVQFSPEERDRMQADIPDNPLAYDYFLRSIAYPQSVEGCRLALEMLEKSIQLDSTYAPAFFELGWRTHQLAQYEMGGTQKIHEAKTAYMKALSRNKELPSALSNLAMIHAEIGQTGKSVELLRRLLEINPNYAEGLFALSYVYRYAGMLEKAKIQGEKALSLDPGNRRFRSIATVYVYLGELEKALVIDNIDPGTPYTASWIGNVYLRMGNFEQAIKYFDRAIALEPETVIGLWALAMKSSLRGNPANGLRALRKWEETNIVDGEQLYHLGNVYALLGDKTACIQALQKAVDAGFFNYPFMLRDSFLDSVRNDPEFHRVLAKASQKHEAFKRGFF